jgi:DNA-binding transcriptional MerR regulator
MNRKRYSTVEVAKKAGVPRATLQFWIATGKIPAPAIQLLENKAARYWSDQDLERIRRLKGSLKPGPKLKKK